MLLEFQIKTNIEIIALKFMHFGFALVLQDIDLWNINILDTHLDLLDTDIPSKPFVSLQDVFHIPMFQLLNLRTVVVRQCQKKMFCARICICCISSVAR